MSYHNNLLSQTLSPIPRHVFQKLQARHKTGRASRQFGFKEQFTVMAFIQLAARRSMRDGLRALSAAGNRLYHWGLKPIARSTFADANNYRPVGDVSQKQGLGQDKHRTRPRRPRPSLADISKAKTHESRMAKSLSLPKGSTVTFDRGYINYSWFRLLGEKSILFVTRLKDNAVYS